MPRVLGAAINPCSGLPSTEQPGALETQLGHGVSSCRPGGRPSSLPHGWRIWNLGHSCLPSLSLPQKGGLSSLHPCASFLMYQPVCLSLPTLRLGSPGQGWEDMWGLWPITDQFGSVLGGECAVIFLLSEMGQHGGLSLESGKRRCVRGGRVGRGSGKPPPLACAASMQSCSDLCDTSLFPGGHVPSSQARQGPGRPQGFSA